MKSLLNSSAAVAFFAALLFIPFLGNVHLFDWDEINFAESAREMLITQEFFRVQINFQPFWEKPPFFFWLQALSMSVFGVNEFAARFPNALCGIITLSLLFHIGKKTFNTRFAWLWVLFMMGSFTPALYFKSGIIDPWFNLFIFAAVWQLSLVSQKQNRHERTKRYGYIGILLGLAVLTKGPVALLVAGLCAGIYFIRSGFNVYFNVKQLALALLGIIGIASLWVVVEISKNGPKVLMDFMEYQIDLFKNPVAGHGQPWFYHPVVLLVGCFPSSLFAIKGFLTHTQHLKEGTLKQWMGILFWVVLILFSLVTTKIVHYSSLCYMPLTFMAALGMDKLLLKEQRISKWLTVPVLLFGLLISALLSALPFIEHFKTQLIPYIKDDFAIASLTETAPWIGYEWLIGLLLASVIVYVFTRFQRQKVSTGIFTLLVSFTVAIPLYMVVVVPKIETYSQGPAIAFYESLKGKDVYVESLGHKSYAQYFYSNSQPHSNPLSRDMNWLLAGDIDKPVYFVVKVNHLKNYTNYHLTVVQQRGGFALLVRMPGRK
ncbi:MAG: glycosyltransferase family 39 protein [Bacteroidota bacterium]